MPLARADLKSLAMLRLREAKLLMENSCHEGAYYLAGYAVELGLKASLARQFKSEIIPDWALGQRFRSHIFLDLAGLAGLTQELKGARDVDEMFDANGEIVLRWTIGSRYEHTTKELALQLIDALDHPEHGVMQWIRTHW